jgi:hypothetical protein
MKKQIEEKQNLIEEIYMSGHGLDWKDSMDLAEQIFNAGYRKQSEGHWFIAEYEFFTCSECNYDYYNECSSTRQAKERLTRGCYPNFCPGCGANMTGAEDGKAKAD